MGLAIFRLKNLTRALLTEFELEEFGDDDGFDPNSFHEIHSVSEIKVIIFASSAVNNWLHFNVC